MVDFGYDESPALSAINNHKIRSQTRFPPRLRARRQPFTTNLACRGFRDLDRCWSCSRLDRLPASMAADSGFRHRYTGWLDARVPCRVEDVAWPPLEYERPHDRGRRGGMDHWRRCENGLHREEVCTEIREALKTIPVTFGQPIGHRLSHMRSGVSAKIAVKIRGPNLDTLRRLCLPRQGNGDAASRRLWSWRDIGKSRPRKHTGMPNQCPVGLDHRRGLAGWQDDSLFNRHIHPQIWSRCRHHRHSHRLAAQSSRCPPTHHPLPDAPASHRSPHAMKKPNTKSP